jgi:flagellar biosynthesis/type III secretory pathway M-ring protein FliF/YscJ
MNIKELLQNKTILYSVIGGACALVFIIILAVCLSVGGKSKNGEVIDKIEKEAFEIVTTDNQGKAIEIQSILARYKINAKRKVDGSKTTVFLEGGKYTNSQRDEALLILVKSGLIDQNVGLEIFDKNDFTSTREDKRIKLARAVNGELSRLIRKMPNIDNATVLVSIPENTMFKADKKPISATVMLTVPSGVKLDVSVIKAIKSLLMGSVVDLAAENISITDSNGNVYNSLVKSIDDQISKVQENDSYIQNKVAAQLDMLIGKGNYVVTVSTQLNQVPKEVTSIKYSPENKTSLTEQNFKEGLGDTSQDSNKGSDAVSVYLPNGLQNSSSTSNSNKNYSREATETTFGVDKTHTSQYYKSGIIEKITIAVTMNADAMPPNMSIDELKSLIASSASTTEDNVAIAFAETIDPYLASDRPVNLPTVESSGNPWWLAIVLLIAGLIVGFVFVHKKLKDSALEQEEELKKLKQKTTEQEKQIVDVNLKAAELIEKQTILTQELLEQQKQLQIEKKQDNGVSLDEVLEEVSSDIAQSDSAKTLKELKSWIEKS